MDKQDTASDNENSVKAGEDTKTQRTGIYATEVGQYDVLLGRGTGPSMNEGNVHFREAVEALKSSYISTPSRKIKKQIVRKIVSDTQGKKGRFLNKLTKTEIKLLGLSGNVLYEVVPDQVALEKTKQAIRYVHYKKDSNRKRSKSLEGGKDEDLLNSKPLKKPRLSDIPRAAISPRIGGSSPTLVSAPPLNLNSLVLPGGRVSSLDRLSMLPGASSLLSSPSLQAILGSRMGLGPTPFSLATSASLQGLPLGLQSHSMSLGGPLSTLDSAMLHANLQLSKAVAALAARDAE